MANRTDADAAQVHSTNPQYLIEKILRGRIYANLYWKEHCFGLTAETLIDKAARLDAAGGTFSANAKPTPFLCLALKLLQIQPDEDVIAEYLRQTDFKYLRALGAFYVRLTAKARDVYTLLEPLLADSRKLCVRSPAGWTLTHVDEFVDELLTAERCCEIALPRLPARSVLVAAGQLGPRVSALTDEDLEGSSDEDDEVDEDDEDDEEGAESARRAGASSRSEGASGVAAVASASAAAARRDGPSSSSSWSSAAASAGGVRGPGRPREAADDGDDRERQRRRIDEGGDRRGGGGGGGGGGAGKASEVSQSVAEANAWRARLGLKPLQP